MTLGTTELIQKVFRPDEADPAHHFANSVAGATASHDAAGWKADLTGAGSAFWHFGGKLAYNVDRFVSVEFLFKPSGMTDGNQGIHFGMISTFNANPAIIPVRVLANVDSAEGAVAGKYRVRTSSDDGVIDSGLLDTNMDVQDDNWYRLRFGFKRRVQTVSIPGQSKPGKSSIQFSMSDANAHPSKAFMRPVPLSLQSTHLSLEGYAGGLQPLFGITGVSPGASVIVAEVCVQYEQVT